MKSGWSAPAAEARFRAMEDELIAERFPEGVETVDVATAHGTTHAHRWRGDGTPIVFLHGMGGTGATWAAYVERLPGRDLVAIDTVGDVGRSTMTTAIDSADDMARWLDDSLAALGIERAHLVGTSYGGWQALNLAARRPQRVAALTLIDAGGLAPFRLGRFMLWGLPSLLGSKAPAPIRRRMARTRPLLEDPRIMKMALLGQMNHRFRMPAAEPLTDDQLGSITVPTTVVIAGRSAPFDPTIQRERARLMRNVTIDVVDGAGHEVSWTHVDRCVAHVTHATL